MDSWIKRVGGNVTGMISVYTYQDKNHPRENVWMACCPELDISGCGFSEDEARRSFKIALDDYLEYALAEGTLEEDLLAHGWSKDEVGKLQEPPFGSKTSNEMLQSVLSMPSFSKNPMPILV